LAIQSVLPSSFRDPSGFIFTHNNILYRQVNQCYAADFDQLTDSGLYDALVKSEYLIPHEVLTDDDASVLSSATGVYRIIKPQPILTISYPYEWCFSQLKDAALLTLKIQLIAMRFGMTLKDASAYNIQFHHGKPVFIDTLSFEKYEEGKPWVSYKQFCQHFLAPLALMSRTDVRLSQLMRNYIDGIPLDLASRLLPKRSYLNFSLLSHIHLHAKTQQKFAGRGEAEASAPVIRPISKKALTAMIGSMRSAVTGFKWKLPDTEWGNYYEATNYDNQAMQHKVQLVREFIDLVEPKPALVQDLGANTGQFSKVAADAGYSVISQDIDPVAVEKNYLNAVASNETGVLPLLLDLTNPSPALGWNLEERMSFLQRSNGNLVLALALIHHLAISNNVPLELIAKFFSGIASSVVIEFVPKADSQVKRLLASRVDIFSSYDEAGFESAFAAYFEVRRKEPIQDSERTLYLMSRKLLT
jgi:ribosomal protein L11 methylase PrmA